MGVSRYFKSSKTHHYTFSHHMYQTITIYLAYIFSMGCIHKPFKQSIQFVFVRKTKTYQCTQNGEANFLLDQIK